MSAQLPEPADKGDIWNRVLRATLTMPGARVDRTAFLHKEFSKHFPLEIVESAISKTPAQAGIPAVTIRRIAESSISWHRSGVTAASFAAGLPGGWWMAGTMPADLTQFFWHIAVVLQKLAYLHGWPELLINGEELDDETLHIFTIFVGVMFGATGAGKLLAQLSERLSEQIATRLPKEALTKWGLYRLARSIAKWIGVKLTKESFSRVLSKAIPVLGAFVSGTITWISISQMSNRLLTHLEKLHPHTGTTD
ncbi:hypothetical protein [Pseudoduganella namucuonensis]|uniref:EcsC protein family protein n=1 Tax=Pseudoduganella namucuonensis TaxID=1035707 RepID=A0A1I7I3P7_9BURK|nr:hypothetical protein [Pseudoduganella namucuonensis]SFU67559.1 hypothetical protein SAMN05216552_100770 [Pseudoduganella namucuonensis]